MPPETEAQTPLFQFDGIGVKGVTFETIDFANTKPTSEPRPRVIQNNLAISASIRKAEDQSRAIVTLDITLRTDPTWIPYLIKVVLSGKFARRAGTPDEFDQFLKNGAPAILFPYVRQLVSTVTQDGLYGPCRLDPISLQMLAEGWETPTPSNEPEQPSEQSPSASPDSEP